MGSKKQTPSWKPLLEKDLKESIEVDKGFTAYALSTITSSSSSTPQVRMVIHRGFVNERSSREDPSWSKNLSSLSGDGSPWTNHNMLTTTHLGSPKADQILHNSSPLNVSLAWWLAPVGHQYRITGSAYLIPSPSRSSLYPSPSQLAQLSPQPSSSSSSSASASEFDWESERLRIFRSVAPPIRASFVRPGAPGVPVHQSDRDESSKFRDEGDYHMEDWPSGIPNDLEAKTEEEKKWVKQALENFALVVIKPKFVDMVDLKSVPNCRYTWTEKENSPGEWSDPIEVVG